MTELQRIPEVEITSSLEPAISEWYSGVSQELLGALRQMRAAAYVKEAFGREGIEEFAREVKAKKSKVYAYAACYERLSKEYGAELSDRVESSPLSPWQLVEATHTGDIQGDISGALDRAEEENLTVRDLRAERTGSTQNVEMVEKICCPECGSVFAMRDARVWTEEL